MKTSDVDRIINNLSDQMARAIDTQVLMTALGWSSFDISEGSVYGQKYLTAHPHSGIKWDDMMKWVVETFGPSGTPRNPGCWSPDQRWYANNAKFWFRDKQDLEWFMLRWA
jgi:hypothetical protein